jgi:HAMP domain-containing protein
MKGVMKLEQRLIELTKALGRAREAGDQDEIEELEDEIEELEYQLEQQYEDHFDGNWS